MKPTPSTAEILAFRMLGRPVDKKWTDWAYDMMAAGFETENLVMLAGETEPYNQFELQSLADKVFCELNLSWDDREVVYRNYACYLISRALDGQMSTMCVLSLLRTIYMENDLDAPFQDFYMLYCAADDLQYSENQYYWDGATRENIDTIIEDYFRKWKINCA